MYVVTRKRKEGREYKCPPDVVNYRIVSVLVSITSGCLCKVLLPLFCSIICLFFKLMCDMFCSFQSTIEDFVASGANSESVEQIVNGDKVHGPSWLVGRYAAAKKMKNDGEGSSLSKVEELTAVIRSQLEEEMEQKMNQKMKENMMNFMKKLAEDNPNLTINIEADSGEFSSESL